MSSPVDSTLAPVISPVVDNRPAVPPRLLRTAIIGTGGIAAAHMRGLKAHVPRVEVVAVQDVDAPRVAKFAAEHGVARHYTEVAEMLRDEKLDYVHICTPPGTHAQLAIQAMEAGAHVLCEKPLCASLAELDRVQEVERRTQRFCASVFQIRHGSSGRRVAAALHRGDFGRPLVAVCNTLWYRDHGYYQVPWRGKWATEAGGPTMGHGIHAMDFLLYLLGPWQSVRAVARTQDRAIEVEDVSTAIVTFADGCVATVVNSVLSPREETYLRIDGQKGTVELSHVYEYRNAHWRFTPAPGAVAPDAAALLSPADDMPSTHGAQIGAILDDITNGTMPITAGAEARRTMDLLTSIYKSAFTDTTVAAGSIRPGDPYYAALNGGNSQPAMLRSA